MLTVRVSLIAITCAACGFEHGVASIGGNGSGTDGGVAIDDAPEVPPDAAPDAPPDARACWGTFVEVCFMAPPTNDITISAPTTWDTSMDAMCSQVKPQAGGPELCVVAAQTIHVNARLTVRGDRPLVLLGTQTIDLDANGVVDLASWRETPGTGPQVAIIGAGEASGALCGTPTGGGNDNGGGFNGSGGGGGAGGSFGAAGGAGAKGRNNSGGNAGTPSGAITSPPTIVRGGCPGTGGGNGGANVGGAGGNGGGAVLLVAGTSISSAGEIRASGMGGYSGARQSGGGGGGAGGFIGLDAPTISNTGAIHANGGGGGEGGGQDDPGRQGASGLDPNTRAPGGNDYNPNGGDAGSGGQGAGAAGNPGLTANNGGGAGGGSVGVIRIFQATTLGGTVSPAPI
jgi:hypothetical protein